jgi:Xaa-Pro aminopeptidase
VNVRWLTGFMGSAALLLVTPDGMVFVSDGRYGEQARDQLARAGVDADIEIELSMAAQRDVLSARARGIARLGLEADGVTWAQQRIYASEWFPGAELIPTEGLVDRERQVKDEGEVARIGLAASIADEALAAILPMLGERPTEQAFARARHRDPAAGSRRQLVRDDRRIWSERAKPHARPSERVVERGDLVVIDFGAKVDGYCSDMTRTFSVGEPSPHRRACSRSWAPRSERASRPWPQASACARSTRRRGR